MKSRNRRQLRAFLTGRLGGRVLLGARDGRLVVGTLLFFSCRVVVLQSVKILHGGNVICASGLKLKTADIVLWQIPPDRPPPAKSVALYGRITDCRRHTPVAGAFIRVLLHREQLLQNVLGYTYSNPSGWYLFPICRDLLKANDVIEIQVAGPPADGGAPSCASPGGPDAAGAE